MSRKKPIKILTVIKSQCQNSELFLFYYFCQSMFHKCSQLAFSSIRIFIIR